MTGWLVSIIFLFSPLHGVSWSKLDQIFFKWVGSTTNYRYDGFSEWVAPTTQISKQHSGFFTPWSHPGELIEPKVLAKVDEGTVGIFFFSDVFLCPEKIEGQISNYVLKKHGVFFRFGVGWIRWILGAIFFCVGSFFFKKSFLEHLEFGWNKMKHLADRLLVDQNRNNPRSP